MFLECENFSSYNNPCHYIPKLTLKLESSNSIESSKDTVSHICAAYVRVDFLIEIDAWSTHGRDLRNLSRSCYIRN